MIEIQTTLAFWAPGATEIIIVLVIAVLLFGKRLPEVGKSLGKGIVEFKKGLHGLEDEVKSAGKQQTPPANNQQQTQINQPQQPMNLDNNTQQQPQQQQTPAAEKPDEQQS